MSIYDYSDDGSGSGYFYDGYDDSSDRYGDNDSYDRPENTKSYDEDNSCRFEYTSHCRELLAELNNQRQSRDFLDVLVKVQGRRFCCHRAVLASSTPFFKAMLSRSSHLAERKSKVVELRGIDSTSFSKILDFLYTGKICISKDDVQDILQAAHMLQFEKITQYCQEFIEDNLDLSNCIGVMRLADLYGFSDLTEKARDKALSHFSEIGKNEEFQSLLVEELLDLLTDENLHVINEDEVVDSVIRWLDHDPESRRAAIVTIFQEIRLLSVRVSALMKLESHPVIQDSPECLAKVTAAKEKHLATRRVSANAEADEAKVRPRLGTSDDLAILVGGWRTDEQMTRNDELLPLQSVICLDPDSEQCYHVANLPTPVSGYMSVTSAERRLYVTGGRAHPLVGQQGPHSAPSRQAFQYEFPTDTWTQLPDMPRGRAGHQSAVVDGKLFLVGGDTEDTPVFTMDCYDLEEGAWINLPGIQIPEPLVIDPASRLTVTACGSKLVIVELLDFKEESHRLGESRKLPIHRFDVETADWLTYEMYVFYSNEACMLNVVQENVHILLQLYQINFQEMFVFDVERVTLSKLEDRGDWTGSFCSAQYMYEHQYMIHQEDLADVIIYSKFDEDTKSITCTSGNTTLDLSFALLGHSFLATQKSTIGWYCRDLELDHAQAEDETGSSG